MIDKRDYREETALNAAEFALLKFVSSELGQSKSATLRYCLHRIGDELMRNKRLRETGLSTED